MILPDVNILLPAVNTDHPDHARAGRWVRDMLMGPDQVAIADFVQSAVVRIASDPRALKETIAPADTLAFFAAMIAGGAVSLSPGPAFSRYFSRTIRNGDATGALVSDAHIAAIALEHGCIVATRDKDFKRFSLVESFDPFEVADEMG